MPTVVKSCNCSNLPSTKYQDLVYGKGMRIHNEMTKTKSYKCTVCGSVKK